MTKLCTLTLTLLIPTLLWSAGEAPKEVGKEAVMKMAGPTKAVCVLHHTKDSKVHGVVVFTVKGNAIEVTGEVVNLTPGLHGFHVHEFGDCSAPDALSTGGHFNPTKAMHGGPDSKNRHVGDLGNIMADASGKAVINITDPMIKLSGPHSIIGRGLIVHAKADDEKTQPTGDAGGRVACGVIGIGKGGTMASPK
jgi:superoxide dismutase, Cu-Zn family